MYINGEPLTFLRKSQNLTIKELAEISGLNEKTIENIEKGKGNPQYSTLCLLSDIFKVPLDILCGRNVEMYQVLESGEDFQIVYYDKDNNKTNARVISFLKLNKSWGK